jgi:hypothetical protein
VSRRDTRRRPLKTAALVLAALVGGCSGEHAYRSDLPANVSVTTKASGSLFSSVRVRLHVYDVGAGCRAAYRGTVELGGSRAEVGVPAGSPSWLVFEFPRSSLVYSSTTHYEILLTPRRGYRYDLEASYADDLYGATIYERAPGAKTRKEIANRRLGECGL